MSRYFWNDIWLFWNISYRKTRLIWTHLKTLSKDRTHLDKPKTCTLLMAFFQTMKNFRALSDCYKYTVCYKICAFRKFSFAEPWNACVPFPVSKTHPSMLYSTEEMMMRVQNQQLDVLMTVPSSVSPLLMLPCIVVWKLLFFIYSVAY